MFKFHEDRLNLEESLGSGNFGEVFPYQKDPNDLEWVVKRIIARNTKEFVNCLPEIIFGFSCDHPCVVPVKGYFIEEIKESRVFQVYLKIPRMKESLYRNFKDRKSNKNPFEETEIIQHFYSLICGLEYLHKKNIYHGDIRHDNLLLDERGNLKIADIGIAMHVDEIDSYQTVTGQKGPATYTAPEISNGKVQKYQLAKADVWSLGVVILELCAFELRILKASTPQEKLNQINKSLESLEGKYQKSLIGLIKEALSLEPTKRPTIESIKARLEKEFGQYLDQDLVSLNKPLSPQINPKLLEDQITALTQQIKKLEAEREQFTELKSQIGQCLSKHQAETKKLLQNQGGASQKWTFGKTLLVISVILAAFFSGLFTPQILGLQEKQQISCDVQEKPFNITQSNMTHEQEGKFSAADRHLETLLKDEANVDKSQEGQKTEIKPIEDKKNESQKEEQTQDETKIEEQSEIFQLEVDETDDSDELYDETDYSDEDIEIHDKAIVQLNEKHSEWFEVYVNGTVLCLHPKKDVDRENIKNEHISALFRDTTEILQDTRLSFLSGLQVYCDGCKQLTSEAFADLKIALLKSKPLSHLDLNFAKCPQLNDAAFEHLTQAISLHHLNQLYLNFTSVLDFTPAGLKSIAYGINNPSMHFTISGGTREIYTDEVKQLFKEKLPTITFN